MSTPSTSHFATFFFPQSDQSWGRSFCPSLPHSGFFAISFSVSITRPSHRLKETPHSPRALAMPATVWSRSMWVPALGSMGLSVQQGEFIAIVASMQFDEPSPGPCQNPSQCPLQSHPKFDFGINQADLGGDLLWGPAHSCLPGTCQ